MKTVELYATGECNYKDNGGYWIYYLEWNGAVLKRSNSYSFNDKISPTKVTLYSIYKALCAINEPCIVRIHTKINIGLNNVKNSPNKEYLRQIHDIIIKDGHQVTWDTEFNTDKIDQWEQENNNNKSKKHINYKEQSKIIREREQLQETYDINIEEQAMQSKNWRDMYAEFMGPSQGCWVQGSGGY